jgi:hypothetical protein
LRLGCQVLFLHILPVDQKRSYQLTKVFRHFRVGNLTFPGVAFLPLTLTQLE